MLDIQPASVQAETSRAEKPPSGPINKATSELEAARRQLEQAKEQQATTVAELQRMKESFEESLAEKKEQEMEQLQLRKTITKAAEEKAADIHSAYVEEQLRKKDAEIQDLEIEVEGLLIELGKKSG